MEKRMIMDKNFEWESYRCIAERDIKAVVDRRLLKCFGHCDKVRRRISLKETDFKIVVKLGVWKTIMVFWKKFKSFFRF